MKLAEKSIKSMKEGKPMIQQMKEAQLSIETMKWLKHLYNI